MTSYSYAQTSDDKRAHNNLMELLDRLNLFDDALPHFFIIDYRIQPSMVRSPLGWMVWS